MACLCPLSSTDAAGANHWSLGFPKLEDTPQWVRIAERNTPYKATVDSGFFIPVVMHEAWVTVKSFSQPGPERLTCSRLYDHPVLSACPQQIHRIHGIIFIAPTEPLHSLLLDWRHGQADVIN